MWAIKSRGNSLKSRTVIQPNNKLDSLSFVFDLRCMRNVLPAEASVKVPISKEAPNSCSTDEDGLTSRLSNWLANLKLADVPHPVRERTKLLSLDGLACALVGARLPWSAIAVNAIGALEGGKSAIIGWNRGATATAAAMLNSSFIQGFELDDFHPLAPIHGASIVIPSLLATEQEVAPVSGQRFLLGAVAGLEVGPRVGAALHGTEMLSRGWHSGPVFGTFSAAAAAGVLLRLNASQFEDALGIAGTQSAGLTGARFGAMCKRIQHGFAARNGLHAAFLAAAGYNGIKKIFELEHGGFLSVYGEGHSPDSSLITSGLGQLWEIERIITKTYAAMGGIHAPLDALFDIASKRKLIAEEIHRIDVDLPEAAFRHGGWMAELPFTPVAAQMNVAYCLAVAVIDRSALVRQFSPQRIVADDVWRLIPRIHVRHDTALDEGGSRAQGSTRVTVQFTDGSRLDSFLSLSKAITEPLSEERVVAKFLSLTDGIVKPERQQGIIETVLGIEKLSSVSTLIDLLAADVGAVFEQVLSSCTSGERR